MCGIAGVATRGSTPPRELIAAMCDVMRHRGPDGEGIFAAPGVGLGMRRLAVLDLATGDQPVANEAGTVHAVFNGEIYNYRELRAELAAKGHRFRGTGDSEVIPRLYQEHGLAFLSRLNGMFALALWDSESQRLLLARDRMGIKPLYYSVHGGNVWFASEVKCILAGGGTARAIDPLGVDQLLTFEYTASPTTLFEDVKKLPPGSWLTVGGGKLHQGRFWSLPTAKPSPVTDVVELTERVRQTVLSAVRRQLASDVPLGAFLSGGIDSSILVAAMKEVSPVAAAHVLDRLRRPDLQRAAFRARCRGALRHAPSRRDPDSGLPVAAARCHRPARSADRRLLGLPDAAGRENGATPGDRRARGRWR